MEFISPEFEQLRSPYYDDYFFQNIQIINEETEELLLYSEFQGKFLQNVWDVLIKFESIENTTVKLKQFGKMKYYKIMKNADSLTIQLADELAKNYSYQSFYSDFYHATKNYLNLIRRENPRIGLDELYQQLAASCYYYERHHQVSELNTL